MSLRVNTNIAAMNAYRNLTVTEGNLGKSLEKLSSAAVDKVIVTDTIPLREGFKKLSKLQVVTIAPLIAETILRIQRNDSVSALLE